MNWTKLLMQELGSIYSITQAQKHFSVMVNMPDCCASHLGSIPDQAFQFLAILFYLIHLF